VLSSLLKKPNLTPPVTTTDMALAYKEKLQQLEPNVRYLMTLYLSPDLTVEEVAKAKAAGIVGNLPSQGSFQASNHIPSDLMSEINW
jgi:dihydroorotase